MSLTQGKLEQINIVAAEDGFRVGHPCTVFKRQPPKSQGYCSDPYRSGPGTAVPHAAAGAVDRSHYRFAASYFIYLFF